MAKWLDWLTGKSQLETKATVSRKAATTRVVGNQPLYLQLQRIGGNVTPQMVSSIFLEADAGVINRLVDLANEARQKDCHLHSVLATRELAVQSLKWQIVPFKTANRKRPTAQDQKVADVLEAALLGAEGDMGDPTVQLDDFRGLLGHLMGAPYLGHATSETVMKKVGRYMVPAGFNNINQRRFQFSLKTGRLEWRDQSGASSTPVDLMVEYPGKFIQYQPRVTGDIPTREGLVRPLMWAALFRNWDIRDWLALAELAWKPWRLGKYQKTADDKDISGLIDVLEAMTASGVAVYPETDEIKVEWPKNPVSGGKGTHSELAAFMAAEMSKAVLGQTLTTEQGANGARSLGEVHDKVRGDIRDADAVSLASIIRRQLLTPLVQMNFGADVAVPGFEFLTQEAVDVAAFSLAILNLRKAGLPIPSAWVYDRFGIPAPDESDELLGPLDGGSVSATDPNADPASPPPTPPPPAEDPVNADPNAQD